MFSVRSYKKELLDQPNIPFADIRQNMRELDVINRRLGGHGINISAVRNFFTTKEKNPVRILEIGCGDGNNLRQIADWGKRNGVPLKLSGVDINEECIRYAETIPSNSEIKFQCSDYRDLTFREQPDIIFSSLFCHHFTDEEVIHILQWKHHNAARGFFINDLHRHPAAYYSIQLITKFFSKSYLVRNDAPLSVARSFRRKDWELYFKKAGVPNFDISWQWAFRWLIISKK